MLFVDTGDVKMEKESEEVNADLDKEISFGMDGNPMNVKNALNNGGVNEVEDEAQILGQEGQELPNINEGGTPQPQQQQKPIWKFFTQIPNEEYAATCSICGKTIKSTNSSTTGMIRHLRNCHPEEFQAVQKARILRTLKNADDTTRLEYFRLMGIPIRDASEAQAALEAMENSISAAFQTTSAAAGVDDMLPSARSD